MNRMSRSASGMSSDEALGGRQHRVGRVHDGLGLARRARRVDQLDDLVGLGPHPRELLLLGGGDGRPIQERLLEGFFARAADGQHVGEIGQVWPDLAHHGDVVEVAPQRRHDGNLGFGEAHHEAQLALAEDRHQRIGDRADAAAGVEQRRELPPVRQLESDHVAAADAALDEPRRDLVHALAELGVGEADLLAEHAVAADEGGAVGRGGNRRVEIVDGQPVRPTAPCEAAMRACGR